MPPPQTTSHGGDASSSGLREGVASPSKGGEGHLAAKEEDSAGKDAPAPGPKRESSIWPNDLPPSPPLTRSNTGESGPKEVDLGDPLHLRAEEKFQAQAELESEDEDEGEPTFATNAHTILEADEDEDGEPVLEVKQPRATVVRQASRIQLDAKMEPQPWDLVEPPPNNGQTNAEYYATMKGKKYNTLLSRRARAMIPKSSYYFGPPPSDSAYGSQPVGQIGLHHPREILRVERDYTGGELVQFAPIYPLELEGRITPTQFLETINAINELLISAHSLRHSFLDNVLSMLSLQLSRLILTSHYEKEMRRLHALIQDLNVRVYNPAGLNILWPHKVAFLFVSATCPTSALADSGDLV
ncbi:Golgin subfamily A member 7/ERF4 family-domain-containing protein [Mycena alexandri]|uniref:Ras modification protein ERF4 n=1 Tax=Mycena alexandri TaxID=1745969 RepID=A0AAD6T0G6_9AGAR|nr:Golgin subfamily A member 7/ERF4 family-domain-containing protein [Mycena alexandri]